MQFTKLRRHDSSAALPATAIFQGRLYCEVRCHVGNSERAEHEKDRKSRGTGPDQKHKILFVLIGVSIITVWTLSMVPSWQAPGDPFLLAAVVEAVTVGQ
jgi:hypothetical protein